VTVAEIDPQVVLAEARDLARQGRFEQALEKHVWFHDHALEHCPAIAGVRLSFALSAWVRLGDQYPPARQALGAIRNRKAAAMRAGDWSWDLFCDVAAINDYLKEESETGALFLDLYRAAPAQAERFYGKAEAGLVALREFGVCSSYILDAEARFRELQARRRHMLPHADRLSEDHASRFREMVEARFTDEAIRLLEILTAAGRTADTERVRSLAVGETESMSARAEISNWSSHPSPEDRSGSQTPA
jgi:hypothetical protein